MPRYQQYNNIPNGNNQNPRNNGQYSNYNNNNNNNRQYNNGSNNRGGQTNGSFNNRPFNNGQKNNSPSCNGPQNGNQRFTGPSNNNPRNTAFYNRVSHNGYNNNINQHNGKQRNGNPSNNNSGIANKTNKPITNGHTNGNTSGNNGNLREGIAQSTSPGGGQPEGHVTINNTVVTHPTPPTRVLDTPRRKSLASRKTEEDRKRLIQQICDYYGISSINDLLKEPDHAPEEWDNLLVNKIYWLRDHDLSLQETRDGLSNQIRTRLRKATKRSDKPAKPYLLAQDIEALIKDVQKANREQSEAEVAATSPTPHQNSNKTTPPTGPKKRTRSSAAVTSEQASTAKRQRRTYVSPEPSVDTDVESLGSVVPLVSDKALAEQMSKVQQAIARVLDAKLEITVALAVLGEDGGVFQRMVEHRARIIST